MKKLKRFLMIIGIFIVIYFVILLVLDYRDIAEIKEEVDITESNIKRQLKEREKIIPEFVNVVKDTMSDDREIYMEVEHAHAKFANVHSIEEINEFNNEMTYALSRLLSFTESYSMMKNDKSYSGWEHYERYLDAYNELYHENARFDIARDEYNYAVKKYNKAIEEFPGNVTSTILNFNKKPYYYYFVQDTAQVLTNEQSENIIFLGQHLRAAGFNDILLFTINSSDQLTERRLSQKDLLEYVSIANGQEKGIIISLYVNENKQFSNEDISFEVGRENDEYLDDAKVERIINEVALNDLQEGNYGRGLEKLYKALYDKILKEYD